MTYKSPQTVQQLMNELVERGQDLYYCNRPPRPSGALLRCAQYGTLIWGYVIPTTGQPSCREDGCYEVDGHCVRNIHAEVDALLTAANHGYRTFGAELFSINKPCYNCSIAAIKAGVATIYYAYTVYDEERTRAALAAAGVKVIHVPIHEG